MTDYSAARAEEAATEHRGSLERLASELEGGLVRPTDGGYEEARRVWNGLIDQFPVGVARVETVDDVRAVLVTARETGLGVSIRAGSHSGPGFSTTDGGLVLDLSAMSDVSVDADRGIARARGGATLGDLDEATQAAGFAVPAGIVSDTGLAGLTLGGGTGWLTRPYGLTSDRLRSAEVLTVDGERVTASDSSNPDLFRALQGGGGNFGVVLEFEFDAVPLDHDVAFGEAWYPLDDLRDLLEAYAAAHRNADRRTTVSPYVGALPGAPSTRAVCFLGVYAGDPDEGEFVLSEFLDFGNPLSLSIERLPYVALQRRFDDDAIEGDRYYWKTVSVDDLSPEIIDAFAERARAAPGPRDTALVWPMGGAIAEVAPEATAFYQRRGEFVLNFEAAWQDPDADDVHEEWVRESVKTVSAHASDQDGALPNFGGNESDMDAAREIYGPNVGWLRDVKTAWDPENVLDPSGRIDPR